MIAGLIIAGYFLVGVVISIIDASFRRDWEAREVKVVLTAWPIVFLFWLYAVLLRMCAVLNRRRRKQSTSINT